MGHTHEWELRMCREGYVQCPTCRALGRLYNSPTSPAQEVEVLRCPCGTVATVDDRTLQCDACWLHTKRKRKYTKPKKPSGSE